MSFRAVLVALVLIGVGFCQSSTFEVASVKRSLDDSSTHPATNGPASLSLHKATLRLLIAMAYDLPVEQVSGGPAWAGSEMFDIEAKTAGPTTQAQKMEMLRPLLADRFQLTFHRETRTLSAYALVVAKGGPKFHEPKAGDPPPVLKPGTLAMRGTMKQLSKIIGIYVSRGATFPGSGAQPLTPWTPMPVVDQTGLTASYDVVLDLTREADWFAVLEPQLGLKLDARKIPQNSIVIDNAVTPSGN